MIELDDHVAAVHLLHDAAHQQSDLVGVLLEHAVALGFPHPLDQHLLGRLDRVASELGDREREGEHVPDLGVALGGAGLLDGELEGGILDGLDHGLAQGHGDRAGLVGEAHLDVGRGAVLLAHGTGQPRSSRA